MRRPNGRVEGGAPTGAESLIVSAVTDSTGVPHDANARCAIEGVTEIVEMPNCGHALVIDSGWREVAEVALGFIKRFT